MPAIQDTIIQAVNLKGHKILADKNTLCIILEDLSPNLYKERDFIDKVYNNEVGKILCKACTSELSKKAEYLREADKYLDEENGRNASWRKRLLSYFEKAVMEKYGEELSVTNAEKSVQRMEGNKDTSKAGTDSKTKIIEEKLSVTKAGKPLQRTGDNKDTSKTDTDSKTKIIEEMNLGKYYENKGQMETAFKHYYQAANLGDAKGQFLIGYMYEYGEGTNKNLVQAVRWYAKAAAKGNRGAQHNLGFFYYSGNGVVQNYRKAFEYFMMAAEQGKPDSMCNIGVMYEYGQYVRKDRREALKWYKKALDNGDPNAERYYLSLLRR